MSTTCFQHRERLREAAPPELKRLLTKKVVLERVLEGTEFDERLATQEEVLQGARGKSRRALSPKNTAMWKSDPSQLLQLLCVCTYEHPLFISDKNS